MAREARHRRPHTTSTTNRLVLAAGVTGAGLGVPVAVAGAGGAAAATPHLADRSLDLSADTLDASVQTVALTGAVELAAASAKSAAPTVHVVAPGETLSGIAAGRRTPGGWRSVYLENQELIGSDPDRIIPGQRLHLDPPAPAPAARPAARSTGHVVRSGETLTSIAQDEGVDGGWHSVYVENRQLIGDDPDRILPGQHLTLPAPATAHPPKATPPAAPKPPAHRPAAHKPAAPKPPAHKPAAHPAARAILPVHGYTLTAGYHAAGSHWTHRHTGQDFAVPTGTPVVAVLTGTVVSAGWGGAYGNEVVLRHRDGTYTVYAHLSSIAVHSGQSVTAGARLGRSGATGNVTGPHLHFEVRNAPGYGSDIDPVAWLSRYGLHL
ncbi:LysM peptidoglycan-binding domain-containing M23 family metallopeptidase [Peterkaempfera bronchialis]|uniref:LysM peptidoglycan-binding domain-containing protein n=1 Tax=Peterkaempfera bronchialis TaxID=2126346 RepID=A0A345T4B7_9ACTN|nr:LysM peptidoglycan-binding domain-containing M23 family metallopeptidase [Peterkaempfera bronchialis]AXI80822.1 LysM peptidoglycan-binding domain-containing protein [Peterkaempfera bronchialis]